MKAPWLFCWAGEVSPERLGHDLQAGHRPGFSAQPGKVGRSGGSFQTRKVQQELPASTRIATK